jgi:hypothetical protein
MSIRSIVISQMERVAREQNKGLAPLVDDLPLLDSGLDSLCFAILVARLEDEINVDPFTESPEAGLPGTLGELVKFYERAASLKAI